MLKHDKQKQGFMVLNKGKLIFIHRGLNISVMVDIPRFIVLFFYKKNRLHVKTQNFEMNIKEVNYECFNS